MNVVAPVLPGETLGGKYRVERILGQGGMGVVVAAKHIELDERVAIKFLLGEPSSAAVDRFLREARAAVKVKGEHVCRVLDFGRLETGEPYIVMEHLEGTDLGRKIDKEGAQSPAAAVGWIVEASDALADAHAIGIVHRDVKPANVFLAKRRDGTTSAKVLDFGISKLSSQAQITGTQTPMGSPSYMSPEQMVSAHDVDARTDIWSLGVTLYELLSGKPPFAAESIVQLTVMVREKEPPPLAGIDDDLANVVMKCLAKDPGDRYESIAALVADLAPFAPEEVMGLVRRHARRDTTSGGAAAFAVTALETRAPAPKREADRAASNPDDASRSSKELTESSSGRARGTFAPLQSTLAEGRAGTERRRPRWPLLAFAAGTVAVIAGGAAVLSRSSSPSGIASAGLEAAPPMEKDARPESLDGTPILAPTVASAAPTAAVPSATSTSVVTAPPPVPRSLSSAPASTSRPPPLAPSSPATAAVTPSPSVDAGPPAVQSPSATIAAPPAKPDPRKRRELDREDP